MSLKSSVIALGTVAALFIAPVAMASGSAHGTGPRAALDFYALDTNGDGQISRAEFTAGLQAQRDAAAEARLDSMTAEMLTHANPDAVLGEDELRSALDAMATTRQERMSEMRAHRQENRAERQGEGRAERRAEHRVERGGDQQMRRAGPQARSAEDRTTRMFDWMDADGDGMISAAEFEVAQSRMAARSDRRGNAPAAE